MLTFVLISLFVSCALAVPDPVSRFNINEIAQARDNGGPVTSVLSLLAERGFEFVDGVGNNNLILTIVQIFNDQANQPDSLSQALAIAQIIAVLGEITIGDPGNSCAAADLIDAYANAVRTGNFAGVRRPLNNFLARLGANIDLISQLRNSGLLSALRNAVGPQGNCARSGRTYQFEEAWDAILASANPSQIGLIKELYSFAKKLSNASDVRSNNVGAAATAAALAPVIRALESALALLINFLKMVTSGGNAASAASKAKNALLQGGSRIKLSA